MTVCSGTAEICSRNMLQKFFSQKFVALQQNLLQKFVLQKFVGLQQKFVLQQPNKFAAAICIAEILCRNLLDCSRNGYCSKKFCAETCWIAAEICIAAIQQISTEICCRNLFERHRNFYCSRNLFERHRNFYCSRNLLQKSNKTYK